MVLFPNIVAILSKVLTKINHYKNRLNPIECRVGLSFRRATNYSKTAFLMKKAK
jgi:hypothetical protein